jgi:hypothetical protein
MCPDKSVTYVGIVQGYLHNSPFPSYLKRGILKKLACYVPPGEGELRGVREPTWLNEVALA